MDAKLIRRITDAVEDGEWRQALAISHGLAPTDVEALVGDALLSMRLTRVAFHAGVGLNTGSAARCRGSKNTPSKRGIDVAPIRNSEAVGGKP